MKKPKQIKTLRDLIVARTNRRSVFCPGTKGFSRPIPAAWAANMSGELLFRLMFIGMFIYTKKESAR